jgi:hypothetical protein
MGFQGNRMTVDIRMAENYVTDNSDTFLRHRPVKYLALDEIGVLRFSHTYNEATRQNSVDFISRLMKHVTIPIHIICTDNGLVFQREFERHLEKLGLRHEQRCPLHPAS